MSTVEQSRTWFTERLDPNYLNNWLFGIIILTETAILRILLLHKKEEKKRRERGSSLVLHRASLDKKASELTSWFFFFNNSVFAIKVLKPKFTQKIPPKELN